MDGRPFYYVEETLAGTAGHGIEQSRRLPEPPLVDPHDGVSACCPVDGVGGFPGAVGAFVLWIHLRERAREEPGFVSWISRVRRRRSYVEYGISFPYGP